MLLEVETVGLIGKPEACISETITALYDYLTSSGYHVVVESHCVPLMRHRSPDSFDLENLGEHCDLAITVGGDGTLLTAARTLAPHDVPLIGINMGRLGFLVDISPNDALSKIAEILSGKFVAEERFLLKAKMVRDDGLIQEKFAFNEVAVQRWITPGMIEFDTFINGVFLNSLRSDGLIVSTPTGSTAYALSGGGPILYPSLDAIVLVPINPHTLSNRPIVVDGDSKVEITFAQNKEISAQLTCDDILIPEIKKNDRILIEKAPKAVKILHPSDHNFFEILRAKLRWSSGYDD